MPTEITSQNGTVINQNTNIAVTGCNGVLPAKTVKLTRAQLLAKALKTCRKDKHKRKRIACEKQARKRYPAKNAKKPGRKATKAASHDK
jgi:deoxycytidylate deaminase